MVAASRNKCEHYCREANGPFPSGHLVEDFFGTEISMSSFAGSNKANADSVQHVISAMT